MSKPNEPDYIVVQAKAGSAYVILCGIESANVNKTVNTSDRPRRDCQNPAAIPERVVRVTSSQWDVTGSGFIDIEQMEIYEGCLGARVEYRLLYGQYNDGLTDGQRTGTIIGYRDGIGVMTADNEAIAEDGAREITIAGIGKLTWNEGAPA